MIDYTLTQYIQIALMGGILGTIGMTIILYVFHSFGFANGDMVRAVGSLVTKSYDNSVVPGLIIHFLIGIILAFFYALAIDIFNATTIQNTISYGIAIGLFHGGVVALLLVVAAEHHPVEKFQKAPLKVAALHWGAHVVYGAIVGLIVGTSAL